MNNRGRRRKSYNSEKFAAWRKPDSIHRAIQEEQNRRKNPHTDCYAKTNIYQTQSVGVRT